MLVVFRNIEIVILYFEICFRWNEITQALVRHSWGSSSSFVIPLKFHTSNVNMYSSVKKLNFELLNGRNAFDEVHHLHATPYMYSYFKY